MADVSIKSGDYTALDFTILKNGVEFDVSGFLVLFTAKKSFVGAVSLNPNEDNLAVLTKNSDSPESIERLGGAKVRVHIYPSDFAKILDGSYDYDLQISQVSNPENTITTVISGSLSVTKEITKRAGAL
jgi:hypothetical protein